MASSSDNPPKPSGNGDCLKPTPDLDKGKNFFIISTIDHMGKSAPAPTVALYAAGLMGAWHHAKTHRIDALFALLLS